MIAIRLGPPPSPSDLDDDGPLLVTKITEGVTFGWRNCAAEIVFRRLLKNSSIKGNYTCTCCN